MHHPSAKTVKRIVHEHDTHAFSSRDMPWPMGGAGDPTHRTMQETLMTDPARIVLTIHPPEDQAEDLDTLAVTSDLLDDLQRDLAQRYPTATFSGTSDTRGDLIQIVGDVAQHAYTNATAYATLIGPFLTAIKLRLSYWRVARWNSSGVSRSSSSRTPTGRWWSSRSTPSTTGQRRRRHRPRRLRKIASNRRCSHQPTA